MCNGIEMGSIDKAVVIGFICRLCSKVNRLVIPIFSEEGERLQLVRMIREYLSLPFLPTWWLSFDDGFASNPAGIFSGIVVETVGERQQPRQEEPEKHISMDDPLPKTICLSCIERLKEHNEMRKKWSMAQRRFQEQQALVSTQLANTQNPSTG